MCKKNQQALCKKNQPQVSKEEPEYEVVFFDDVLREELRLVKWRRKVLFPRIVDRIFHKEPKKIEMTDPDPDPPAEEEKGSDKAVEEQRENALKEHLAGLAFSGGGIRSASFAIGMLQGLASLKLLNWFDYLSTVSGGGYAGGWLAAWLKREGNPINVESQLEVNRIRQSNADRQFAEHPDAKSPEWKTLPKKLVLDEEPEPVAHLRAYSSYLTPRGGLFSTDTWTMLAIYLRNVFINLLLLLPLLFFVVLFVRGIIQFYVWSLSLPVRQERYDEAIWLIHVFICVFIVGLLLRFYGLRNVFINRLLLPPVLFFVVLCVRFIIQCYVWSLNPATHPEGSFREEFLCGVFVSGLAFGFVGLRVNAIAIWGLRSTPRIFPLKPLVLFLSVVLPLAVAALLVAASYQGALDFLRTKAVEVLSCLGLGGTAPGRWVSNASFLSLSCLLLHALAFGGLLFVVSFIHQVRSRNPSSTAGSSTAGPALKEPCAAFCGGFVVGILIAVTYELLRFTESQPWLRATIGPPLFLVDIVLGFCVLIALVGRRITELEREWWGRLAGQLLRGALLWLILVGVIVYGPAVLIGLGVLGPIAGPAAKAVLTAAWTAITSTGVWAGQSPKTGTGQGPSLLDWLCSLAPPVFLVGLLTVLSLVTPTALEAVARLLGDPPSSAALTERISTGIPAANPGSTEQARQPSEAASKQGGTAAAFNAASFDYLWNNLRRPYSGRVLWLSLGITISLFATFTYFVDVNLFSLHTFYENRLIRAFLGASRPKKEWTKRWGEQHDRTVEAGAPTNACGPLRDADPVTDFDDEDDIDLVDLQIVPPMDGNGKPIKDRRGKPYWGPHYLINTTMNLIATDNLAWRDRKAEAFCLTPLYCGSKSTGFARVTEDTRKNLTLGCAIAVSGAAVDPNMNYHQSPLMTALLTLFNARLGIWIQNPQKEQRPWENRGFCLSRKAPGWYAGGPRGGIQLIQELLGLTTSKSNYVHISDGGHFENLGVYELLRRRCRYVVAVDATENANATSDNLGILVRLARIDLGIRIVLDTAPLTLQEPEHLSRTHVIIGEIYYDDVHINATTGILVYIRASMTGDEPSDVQQYANNHPEFPRQSIVHQFYGEEQFESYRALGFHVASMVFKEATQDLKNWLKEFTVGWEEKDLVEEHRYAIQRALARLFGKLRSRWLDQPTGEKASYADSVRALVKLQRDLRNKPELAKLGQELYPELGDDTRITPEERVALHVHEEILQLVENLWLGLGLERRETDIGRGWMNTLRRLTSTSSFRRFWPLLRAEYDPNFQIYCERLLRLDADDPRLVQLVPSNFEPVPEAPYVQMLDGKICSTAKQVQNLAAEFAREWPKFVNDEVVVRKELGNPSGELIEHLGPLYVHQLIQRSVKLSDRRSRFPCRLADRPASKASRARPRAEPGLHRRHLDHNPGRQACRRLRPILLDPTCPSLLRHRREDHSGQENHRSRSAIDRPCDTGTRRKALRREDHSG